MSRAFETVEDFIGYVNSLNEQFAETRLHEHIMSEMIRMAYHFVYNPSVFMPKVYRWTYTMADPDYYRTNISKSNVMTTGSSVVDAYTFGTSPHLYPVLNGQPYDYKFIYNGVERPFIAEAEKSLLNGKQMNVLKKDLANFYRGYGLDAK